MNIAKTVAFSGYRPEKISQSVESIKLDLQRVVEKAIGEGFDTFITGMADGFDLYAAECVLEIKKSNSLIKLICALPFGRSKGISEIYDSIIKQADEIITLSNASNRGAYYVRNEFMVDNCSLLICYYDGLAGGTEYTVDYAQKKGRKITNLAPQLQSNMGGIEIFNNTTNTVRDDLDRIIKKDSKVSMAGAYFSIYAFQELKKRLTKIDELRFIFTSPTFTTEKVAKEKREFYIPRLNREKSLYGTEFEVKLRNELTQKSIAKECASWIQKKVTFKSNITSENMMGFINVDNGETQASYMPINGFTTVDIGCERGNNVFNVTQKTTYPNSSIYFNMFDQIWNDKTKLQDVTTEVIDSITTIYKENSAEFIYFVTLYNIFSEFLEDVSEDVLPNEATGFKETKIWNMLYNFQKDAALAIINKLEKFNGCILADSVGLGKTFTALAVIAYYENKNKSILVLCPKKLANNWNTYKGNYINNPIAQDRLNYDVLFHTDLNRISGTSNGTDLDRINWGAYDLVVIDESHNFRNGGKIYSEDESKQNRYVKLLNKVIRKGVKTKVLMLSATPVNNRFTDLKNQLQLAYEGDSDNINAKLNINRPIEDVFKFAQQAFNAWSKFEPEQRTTQTLLQMLDFDFFEVLDSVTIARSRKHIEKYYDTSDVGTFPLKLAPISHRPPLTDLQDAMTYNEIFECLSLLNLSIYSPTHFILESKKDKYAELYGDNEINIGFTQASREQGIKRLTAINLMKRMESSLHSFKLTLSRINEMINNTIVLIDNFEESKDTLLNLTDLTHLSDFDEEDLNDEDIFSIGKKVKIDIADMDYLTWKIQLQKDSEIFQYIDKKLENITFEHDSKLQCLLEIVKEKVNAPINGNNKKIIIFTAFADTANYLYEHVGQYMKDNFNLDTAMVSGTVEARTTIPKFRCDMNNVLTCFSPLSKGKDLLMPNDNHNIDILIATDCISEGQNLQDCDYLINYDIHWNPVRIIQRFGRIDRIGSKNSRIQLVNFWPDISLDEYINLKARVETRMKITVMTSTGDDNPLTDEEKGDLEYRKAQLEKLQTEVVDIEDMTSGISIMDLGLNEFRLDLLAYIKENPSLEKVPFGMHAVTQSTADAPKGVIYVLKNRSNSININEQNRLHPFYMVYINEQGEVVHNHLSPKNMLDKMRHLCKGKEKADKNLCFKFNEKTKDGRDMSEFSQLLGQAITSIIEVKEESDIDVFLGGNDFSFFSNEIKGLDDFELICFLVIN